MLNRGIKSGRASGSEFKPYNEYHDRKILVKKYLSCYCFTIVQIFCIFVHSIIFYIKIYNKNIRNNYIKHLEFLSSNFCIKY